MRTSRVRRSRKYGWCYAFNSPSCSALLCLSLATTQGEVRVGMSNPETMQQLAERFMNDAQFRELMQQDPEGAAERSGYQLDDED
jgi:hypothetical protein